MTSVGISAPPDVVVGEADGTVTLPVTLSNESSSTVTVTYSTSNGTGSDNYSPCEYPNSIYQGASGVLTFNPTVTTQNVTVNLFNCHKSLSTGFYTFFLTLSSPTGATITRSSTQIDVVGDAPATTNPGLYVMNAFADNNSGTVDVPVVLGGPSGLAQGVPVTVDYTTSNGSAV